MYELLSDHAILESLIYYDIPDVWDDEDEQEYLGSFNPTVLHPTKLDLDQKKETPHAQKPN